MLNRRRAKGNRSSAVGSMASAVFNAKDVNSMHQSLNSEFMLYQLILKNILSGKNSKKGLQDGLLGYFKPDEEDDKKTFKEYDTTYKPERAIFWYTRESCVYRMLNKALRTHNTKHLLGFSEFMSDLNTQLFIEKKTFVKKFHVPVFQVYRGQYISKDEVNRIKSGIGQLIAMNSFLSTSTNYKKALEFATSNPPSAENLTSILLEFNVGLTSSTRPFADIKHLSAFPSEEEILFMFGNVFRIDNVWEDTQRKIWRAKFTLCNDGDEDYKVFMSLLEKDVGDKNQLVSLGHFMLEMGNFDEAGLHYRTLIETDLVDNDYDLAACHHGLARVDTVKGDYDFAIDNINSALKYLSKEKNRKNNALIAQCYNDYAAIYTKKNDCVTAFQYYEKAIRIKENNKATTYAGLSELHVQLGDYWQALEFQYKRLQQVPPTSHCLIAGVYVDIGKIYSYMGDREQSQKQFDEAIKIQLKTLNEGHPDLGYSYTGVSLMYSEIGENDKALEYLNKVLQLQLKSLPNNHADFCDTYRHFGNVYMKKKDLDQALVYYKKLLDCQIILLSPTHPSVSDSEVLIGKVYLEKCDYKNSLVYYKRSLDSQLERKPFGDSSLSAMYKDIAEINLKAEDLDGALEYYNKLLDNDLERKVLEDASFISVYRIMGDIHCKKGNVQQGLFYYYRLLDCSLQARPFKQEPVVDTYKLIGKIYVDKPCDHTLLNFNQSIDEQVKRKTSAQGDADLLDDHIIVGNVHFEQRHLDQAFVYFNQKYESKLRKVAEDDASLVEILKILGNVATDKGEFHEASVFMTRLLSIELKTKSFDDPSLINIYKTMGKVYYEKGDFDISMAYYNRLLDVQFNVKPFDQTAINQTYIKMGKIFLVRSFTDKFPVFKALLNSHITARAPTKDSSLVEIPGMMGDERFEQRYIDRVFQFFEQMANEEDNMSLPDTVELTDVYRILGNISIEKRDWTLAVLYYNRLLKETPDDVDCIVPIHKAIGTIHYENNDFQQALVSYEKALGRELERKTIVDPSLAELFKIMGIIFYKIHNLTLALMSLSRTLDCYIHANPFQEAPMAEIYKLVGKIYVKKPFDQTLFFFNMLSNPQAMVPPIVQAQLLINHIVVNNNFFEKRRLDELLKFYEKVLEDQTKQSKTSRSSLLKTYTIFANIFLEKDDVDQGLKYLHKVLELVLKKKAVDDPSHQAIYKMLGNFYLKKKDYDEAAHYVNRWLDCLFKSNIPHNRSIIDAYLMMGEIFYNQQHFDQTMRSINKLYENNPNAKLSATDLNKLIHKVNAEQRHLNGAIDFFQKSMLDQKQALLKRDSSATRILRTLQNMYLHKRAFRQGIGYFQQLLQELWRINPERDLTSANIYEIIGHLYAKEGDKYEALQNYRRSLAIYERILPSTNTLIENLRQEMRLVSAI